MFLCMSRWARNPPSARRVKLVAAILGICLLVWLIEKSGYWPDWATAQRMRGMGGLR